VYHSSNDQCYFRLYLVLQYIPYILMAMRQVLSSMTIQLYRWRIIFVHTLGFFYQSHMAFPSSLIYHTTAEEQSSGSHFDQTSHAASASSLTVSHFRWRGGQSHVWYIGGSIGSKSLSVPHTPGSVKKEVIIYRRASYCRWRNCRNKNQPTQH
jgi:hypothetical protein